MEVQLFRVYLSAKGTTLGRSDWSIRNCYNRCRYDSVLRNSNYYKHAATVAGFAVRVSVIAFIASEAKFRASSISHRTNHSGRVFYAFKIWQITSQTDLLFNIAKKAKSCVSQHPPYRLRLHDDGDFLILMGRRDGNQLVSVIKLRWRLAIGVDD